MSQPTVFITDSLAVIDALRRVHPGVFDEVAP
jgi:hypothetical protein